MIKIFNTLTRQLEEFEPSTPGVVTWYNCGPTVYDHLHLGHARSLVAFDTIRRYLEYRGYKVKFVQNFTDIDDKMIARAAKENRSVIEVAEEFIASYFEDVEKLNIKRASIHPRALLHITHMIEFIQRLIDKEYAYVSNGEVYFDVQKFSKYGELSKHKLENILQETEDAENPNKRYPADFALWKKRKPGEPSWLAPWGEGRPGWHIECSVMSITYLGDTIDIHSGGQDLIFPHHENEIAQAEALTGKQFVKYWLHNGYLNINSEKMSKSLGNFVILNELFKHHNPDAVRLYLLMTHYRQPIDFTQEGLLQAETTAERLFNIILLIKTYAQNILLNNNEDELETLTDLDNQVLELVDKTRNEFIESMDEDFNTSKALAVVFTFAREINNYIRVANTLNPIVIQKIDSLFDDIRSVLGIFENLDQYLTLDTINKLVKLLIELRNDFRREKKWDLSDKIRDRLKEAKILLEDTPKRVIWKLNLREK